LALHAFALGYTCENYKNSDTKKWSSKNTVIFNWHNQQMFFFLSSFCDNGCDTTRKNLSAQSANEKASRVKLWSFLFQTCSLVFLGNVCTFGSISVTIVMIVVRSFIWKYWRFKCFRNSNLHKS
jgi:hypothetical protein